MQFTKINFITVIFFLNVLNLKILKSNWLAFTCKLLDDGSKRSIICSLYISRNEHLQVNLNFSSLRASLSFHDIKINNWLEYKRELRIHFLLLKKQTFWILWNMYSKTLGVMPQLTLCLRVPPSISPSIVCVLPLPVYVNCQNTTT